MSPSEDCPLHITKTHIPKTIKETTLRRQKCFKNLTEGKDFKIHLCFSFRILGTRDHFRVTTQYISKLYCIKEQGAEIILI